MSNTVPERPKHLGEQQLATSGEWNSSFPPDFDPYTWSKKSKPEQEQ